MRRMGRLTLRRLLRGPLFAPFAGSVRQSQALLGDGFGDVDQLGAAGDNRLEDGREEGVMRAA